MRLPRRTPANASRDADIIERLAPIRSGTKRPLRIEPALDTAATRRSPAVDFSK